MKSKVMLACDQTYLHGLTSFPKLIPALLRIPINQKVLVMRNRQEGQRKL